MSVLDFFRTRKTPATANIAKDRLQVIVAHERKRRNQPDYLPQMQQEILAVIRKYVSVDEDKIAVNLETSEDFSVLELNVTLPDSK